ncbi:hypothetical protein NYY70_20910, partial [Acinetobacter baumannii]|nr:hypothetical protein [Acinetobacter baumannii]
DVDTARAAFEASLAFRPTNVASLVGLARVRAANAETGAAIALLERAAAIGPQPETLALLGDLLASRDDGAAAAARYGTVRFTAELSALA